MKLLFKQTVNDKANAGRAFFAGRTYDLVDERAKEIMEALPEAVEVIGVAIEAKAPKAKKKKTKSEATVEKTSEDILADELEREVNEFVEAPTEE